MAFRQARHLFAPGRKRRPGLVVLALALLLALGAAWVSNAAINRSPQLLRQYVTVPELSRRMEGLRILHLSDLHAARFGAGQAALLELLRGEPFDLVVMTGDMVGRGGDAAPLMELLAALPPEVPKLLIAGDDDPAPVMTEPHGDSEVLAPYIRLAAEAGATYLDRPYRMETAGGVLWLIPALLYEVDVDAALFSARSAREVLLAGDNPYAPEAGARLRAAEYQIGIMQDAQAARTAMRAEDLCIAVTHVPPGREDVIAMRGDAGAPASFPGRLVLTLAGHLNAGQVRLPGRGALHVPQNRSGVMGWLPDDRQVWGLRSVLGVGIHTSPGLGASGAYAVPLRVFNRPGMTLLTLTSKIR